LPATLDQTYDRILCGISRDDAEYAVRILWWLTFSARPLFVEEVAEVVAIDTLRDPAFDHDEVLEDPLEVLNICSSLVTITAAGTKTGNARTPRYIIALAHYSVQEYLVSERIKQGPAKQYSLTDVACHSMISEGCLKYLLHLQSSLLISKTALAAYSAEFWSDHLHKSGDDVDGLSRLAVDLLSTKNPSYFAWIELCNRERMWQEPDWPLSAEQAPGPLYYATHLGLETVIRYLLDNGADPNEQKGFYGNPLQVAAFKGHTQIAKMLLEAGADVNARGGYFDNAVYAASAEGHEQVLSMLLDANAEINVRGGYYGNALSTAMNADRTSTIELLLDRGADPMIEDNQGCTALMVALKGGHIEAFTRMLEKGVVLSGEEGRNLRDFAIGTPSLFEEFKLMLARDVEMESEEAGRLLDLATDTGNIGAIRLFLEGGLYPSSDEIPRLLGLAADGCHSDVVIRLLNATTETCNDTIQTFLRKATNRGHLDTVKLFLEKIDDIDDDAARNILDLALEHSHCKVLEILISKSVDPNLTTKDKGAILRSATADGDLSMVKTLLDLDANVNTTQENGCTPLCLASEKGLLQVAEFLLEQMADPNASHGSGWSPLLSASHSGHAEVVKLLLQKGAQSDAPDNNGWRAIHAASRGGHVEVVRLLLDDMPENFTDVSRCSPLYLAAAGKHQPVVSLLLDHKVRFAEQDVALDHGILADLSSFDDYMTLIRFLARGNKAIDLAYTLSDDKVRQPRSIAARGARSSIMEFLMGQGLQYTPSESITIAEFAAGGASVDALGHVLQLDFERALPGQWNALHWACRAGNADTVDLLIARGWESESVTIPEAKGDWTPLDVAIFHGNKNMLSELSFSSRAALGIDDIDDQISYPEVASHDGVWCDGCFHVSLPKDRQVKLRGTNGDRKSMVHASNV
jgi:ankyrin repeat protein